MRDINLKPNKNCMEVRELTSIADELEILIDYHARFKTKLEDEDFEASSLVDMGDAYRDLEDFFWTFWRHTRGFITNKQQREMQDE